MAKILSQPEKIAEIDSVPIILTYKTVKNINIRFQEEVINISAPPHLTIPQILEKLDEKRLRKQLASVKKRKRSNLTQKPENLIPYYLRFFGRIYALEYVDNLEHIRLHKKKILIPGRLEKSPELVEAIDCFIEDNLRQYINQRLAHWKKITDLEPSGYQIRKMKTRWGSCTHSTGRIRFNFYLSVLPKECIDTVILHELAHLKVPNHQEEFYEFINKYLPSYKRIHNKIKSYKSPEDYILYAE